MQEEERRFFLEVELLNKEVSEMSRRIAEMKLSVDKPRLQKITEKTVLSEVVAPVLEVLMEEQKEIFEDVGKSAGACSIAFAEGQ